MQNVRVEALMLGEPKGLSKAYAFIIYFVEECQVKLCKGLIGNQYFVY